MSRPSFDVEEQYTGNNVTDTFSFDFKITSETQLEVIVMNASGVELERGYGSANSYVDTVTIDGDNGGEVLLNAPLPTNYKLILLLADDEPVQSSEFRNKFDFTLKRLEDALDRVAGAVQRLAYIGKRALRIHETDDETAISTVFPPGFAAAADRAIIVNEDGDGIDYGPTSDEIENAQSYALAAAASAVDADNSADAALASEGLAEDWATKTSATVDGSEYSSKEYAIGVQRRGLANGGSAKDWANYTGGTVDDTEFSAKKYAQDAATSAASMAQRDLSNLTSPTAVNQDILPDASATRSIGSAAAYWLNMVAQFFIVPSGVSGRFGTANRTDGSTSNDSIFRSGNVSGTLSGVQTGNNTSKSGDILTGSTGTGDTGFNAVTSGAIGAAGVTGVTGDVQTSSGNNAGTGKTGDRYDSTGDASAGDSGDIYRYTGQASANSGSIEDTTGDAAAGDSGDIKHTTGSASGVRGAIIQAARLLRPPSHASDPSSPLDGGLYYNTTSKKLRFYDVTASAWKDVGMPQYDQINALSAITAGSVVPADLLQIGQVSSTANKKTTFQTLLDSILNLDNITLPNRNETNDSIPWYNANLGKVGKASIETLMGGARAYANVGLSGNQNIGNTVWTKVAIDTSYESSGITLDSGNNRLIPTVAGIYLVLGRLWKYDATDTAQLGIRLTKNGGNLSENWFWEAQGSTKDTTANSFSLVSMNGTTDFIEMEAYQDTGITRTLQGANSATNLYMVRIR